MWHVGLIGAGIVLVSVIAIMLFSSIGGVTGEYLGAVASLTFIAGFVIVLFSPMISKKWKYNPPATNRTVPQPSGYTTDGKPIYPVVGYTSDGAPVTADRAVGVGPQILNTNSMAIAALVSSLVLAPLGIVFGHIALKQITRTNEAGRGLAIAGLVVGYLFTALAIVAIVATAVTLSSIGSAP